MFFGKSFVHVGRLSTSKKAVYQIFDFKDNLVGEFVAEIEELKVDESLTN